MLVYCAVFITLCMRPNGQFPQSRSRFHQPIRTLCTLYLAVLYTLHYIQYSLQYKLQFSVKSTIYVQYVIQYSVHNSVQCSVYYSVHYMAEEAERVPNTIVLCSTYNSLNFIVQGDSIVCRYRPFMIFCTGEFQGGGAP